MPAGQYQGTVYYGCAVDPPAPPDPSCTQTGGSYYEFRCAHSLELMPQIPNGQHSPTFSAIATAACQAPAVACSSRDSICCSEFALHDSMHCWCCEIVLPVKQCFAEDLSQPRSKLQASSVMSHAMPILKKFKFLN